MSMTTVSNTEDALISIVDDEPCVRKSLGRFMRSAGCTTREYASAEDFLTQGWWDEPACLILDVRLPAMGGLELQRCLADQQPGRPIIFVSGRATADECTWAMTKGAAAFLPKPINVALMLATVREAISHAPAGGAPLPLHRVCPLCHESAIVAAVPGHLMLDHVDLRALAVDAIKSLNPAWQDEEECCERCWQFYVGLARVLHCVATPRAPEVANQGINTKV